MSHGEEDDAVLGDHGPLPSSGVDISDNDNDGINDSVAAQRDHVMSQVRKRMSSAQFRPEPLEDAETHQQQQPSASPSAQRQQRARGASLAAQIPVPSDAASAPISNNSIARRQQPQQPQHQDPTPSAGVTAPAAATSSGGNNAAGAAAAAAAAVNGDDDDGAGSGARTPVQLTQEQQQEQWRLRRKHFFIFTDAGKPVFTRWGDESDFTELFGILQVLMEMSVSNGLGALKHVCLGSHDVHFFSDEHLRFVMVSATGEPPDTCQHQLRLICHCLLSGCPTVNRVLERNSSYDIRTQLLHPSVFRSLIKSMNHDVPLIFQGIDCGFFDSGIRATLNNTLRKEGFAGYDAGDEDGGGHLMSLIVCRGKILAWGQIPNFQLSTDDLLLLIHFSERCCGSGSAMENTWAPLCLPDYDKEGSFWVHVMQLANNYGGSSKGGAAIATTSNSSDGGTTAAAASSGNTSAGNMSTSPLLIQLATHTEAISSLKQSAQRLKAALAPLMDKISRASAKVMSLPAEWAQLGVMHVLFNRWGVLAYTAPPLHAQERKHRKNFFRTLLQVRAEALALSKTSRPFLMRATPFETLCFSRKVVRLKSTTSSSSSAGSAAGGGGGGANNNNRASAELYVTFLPGAEAATVSAAVNRIWDTLLNKDAWVQFVAPRQNFM